MEKSGSVSLKWITTDPEAIIVECARVSAPPLAPGQEKRSDERLLRYLIKNGHWSPFEMANMCLEIYTTRDISRQVLRHRTLAAQEFSQRYAEVRVEDLVIREPRMQDHKNRQNSLQTNDADIVEHWNLLSDQVATMSSIAYKEAIGIGIAREQARALLPEGMTPTRFFVNGCIRTWLHYCQVRCGNGTQKEHVEIANQIRELLMQHVPTVAAAFFAEQEEKPKGDDMVAKIVQAFKEKWAGEREVPVDMDKHEYQEIFWELYQDEIRKRKK